MIKYNKNNFNSLLIIITILVIAMIILGINIIQNEPKNDIINIKNKMVEGNFLRLKEILGKPVYMEIDAENNLKSATWMSPLDNFHDFGKYAGCDFIKIHGEPSKKFHPHPANLFIIVGKYIKVPDALLGPIKYASETINIEQLFVPKKYNEKYYNTGIKDVALVTGSCASITISAITVQFVIDMINKYKNDKDLFNKIEKLYTEFRNEYDRRIDDYLCGRGITDKIPWFDPEYFNEKKIFYYGDKFCKKVENYQNLTHIEGCDEKIEESGLSKDDFCLKNPEDKCC